MACVLATSSSIQLDKTSFKIIYRDLEFMRQWKLAAGCGGCCQAGSGRTGLLGCVED